MEKGKEKGKREGGKGGNIQQLVFATRYGPNY